CHQPVEQVIPDERHHGDHHDTQYFLGGGQLEQSAAQQGMILGSRLSLRCRRFHTKYFIYAIASISRASSASATCTDATAAAIDQIPAAVDAGARAGSGPGAG